ncbi:MAG: FtsX-like permease family protein [Planctomycetota bacterium]
MLKIFLWLRYLSKRRMVLLSVAAVALSCALLIVVASLFSGFINTFERSSAEALGDIVIAPQEKIENYQELTRELEGLKSVEAATGTLSAQGLLHIGRGNVRAVEISGIDLQKEGRVTAFEKSLLKGKTEKDSDPFSVGYVGIGVLSEPNEKTDEYDFNAVEQMIGQTAVLSTGSIVNEQDGSGRFRRRTIQFTIADVVFTGVYYLDKRIVYLPIERVQEAMYPEAKQPIAGQVHIKLQSSVETEVALAQIRGVWGTFASQRLGWEPYQIEQTRIETARQMQARYVAEIRKQMGVLLLIFGVVSLSAVLLVFCIFYMIVETRRKDVAIMKSCGAGSASVATIFIGFGGFIGTTGAAIGTALGYIITKNINAIEGWIRVIFGLKLWKASVYMFSRIPSEVDWPAVVWIVLSAIAGAAIGAGFPAISAAMTRPVNVLRYE